MLPAPLSAGLGFCFILFGAAAVWLIFEASRRLGMKCTSPEHPLAHREPRDSLEVRDHLYSCLACARRYRRLEQIGNDIRMHLGCSRSTCPTLPVLRVQAFGGSDCKRHRRQ